MHHVATRHTLAQNEARSMRYGMHACIVGYGHCGDAVAVYSQVDRALSFQRSLAVVR